MKPILWLAIVSCFASASALGAVAETNTVWKAGAAAVKITPEQSMWMAGYAARTNASQGVAQDLFAKALAVEDTAGARLVIVTYDLIGVPRTLRQALAKRCADAYKLAPESLLLNASHTHCGPEFRLNRANSDDGDVTREREAEAYGRQIADTTFQLIGDALKKLAPARLDYLHARCGFAMNRRRPTAKGFINAPYPDGPVDQDVPVLRVASPDGKQLRALLFGYSCHNTTLGYYQFCGDYAGYAQEYLQAAHPETVALFVQGCGGDQNPYPRRTPEIVLHHGRALANAVETALDTVPRPLAGPLRAAFSEVLLDYAPLPPREELQKLLDSKNKYERGHAKWLLDLMDHGNVPATYPCPVQVVRFGGDFVLVAIGGEVVVDYALRLKKELAGSVVWVAGYTNDVFGYVPSRRVLEEGGYEAGGAMVFSRTHPGPWAPSIEERIISRVHESLKQLASGR
ncbi:MAG: neutral/alkaline non-lysosomal ceramidase N-terminal domain-containing protein [Verrucomicrobia bacterium]|nr:neutral/alkaline non-lysosomal ceramidase N-terminal domain-containing protein [Verrucomicrobiota bacterium]